MKQAWPVVLRERTDAGVLTLRPLRMRDAKAWRETRLRNDEWLRPWEATAPQMSAERAPTFTDMVRRLRDDAREGRGMPFAVLLDGQFVGQLSVGAISLGSYRGCFIGYWIDSQVAGQGLIPTAVAMATDHLFNTCGLHRVELAIRPENQASIRVAEKLGFRYEGMRQNYLHINGDWRDHAIYVANPEDFPKGVLHHLNQSRHTTRD